MQNILYDVLAVITLHVMFWDPLLYVVGIHLFLSFMCFVLTSLCIMLARFSPCMFFYHTDRSLLVENSCSGISLRASSVAFNWSCNRSFSSVSFYKVSYTISTFLEMLTMVSYIALSFSVNVGSIVHAANHINAKTTLIPLDLGSGVKDPSKTFYFHDVLNWILKEH